MNRRNFITTMAASTAAMALPGRSEAKPKYVCGVDWAEGSDQTYVRPCAEDRRRLMHPYEFIQALMRDADAGIVTSMLYDRIEDRRRSYMHAPYPMTAGFKRANAMMQAIWFYGVDEEIAMELYTIKPHHVTYGRHIQPIFEIGSEPIRRGAGTYYGRSMFHLDNGEQLGFVLGDLGSLANPNCRRVRMSPLEREDDPFWMDYDPTCRYWWHITGDFTQKYLADRSLWLSEGHACSEHLFKR
jgi:hypothetical protein